MGVVHGLVDENYYGQSPAKNPVGPQKGTHRVDRGGSWGYGVASNFRGARRGSDPSIRYVDMGFRLVRNRQ